ncbi:MAG: two pore domain potassium channel family protein [Candidatus Nanopelagicales bacterium]|nr:two pore domain potassium channel family protein [Candidatus Nanopelagicales bacterium]
MATQEFDPVMELTAGTAELGGWAKAKIILVSIFRTLIGIFVIAAVLVIVPARPHLNLWIPVGAIILMIGLYLCYFRLQLRRIRKARYPRVQAAEALVLVATMFLAIFAVTYDMLSGADPGSFTENLDRFSALYFAVTVLATVGFGDITPVTTTARSVAMVQMTLDIAFIAVAVKIVGGSASKALAQRQAIANSNRSESEKSRTI